MKRSVLTVLLITVFALHAARQFPAASEPEYRQVQGAMRTLSGQVMDGSDRPVAGAVVYLKNTKTLAVKTFIADNSGGYRFPSLSPNVDYEIYAEANGRRSSTKILSSLDSRQNPSINLKIN